MDLPIFDAAQRVSLKVKLKDSSVSKDYIGMRIPYSSDIGDLEKLFRDPQEFLMYCESVNLGVLWEDTLQGVTGTYSINHSDHLWLPVFHPASWDEWSSYRRNILLCQKSEMQRIERLDLENVTVESHSHEMSNPPFFTEKSFVSKAIVFDGKTQEMEQLFEKLWINRSSWSMIEYNGKIYLMENPVAKKIFSIAKWQAVSSLPFFRVEESPIETRNLEHQGGVVVLTMNQGSSFANYPHEILTFLFKISNL